MKIRIRLARHDDDVQDEPFDWYLDTWQDGHAIIMYDNEETITIPISDEMANDIEACEQFVEDQGRDIWRTVFS